MTPILFALVDAVLLEKLWVAHGVAIDYAISGHHNALAMATENEAFGTYGWWRSTWGAR